MGSGSSRSGRAARGRRRRSPDSLPERPGAAAAAAAPEGEPAARAPEAAATPESARRDAGPAAPADGREETLRLLDQLLAESAAWCPREPAPRAPARPGPASGAVSPQEQRAEGHKEASHASEAPGNSHKKPEGQSAISYDYSEEELMASIEREYCH
uniref:cystin-1 n=1 Tax=Jaculus jaculus TaxID=51337 RepID=UPI001E1B372B|nr:cystin-1 [Jaculus jaculus]